MKKIIAIGILGIFLLTSLTALSAIGMKVELKSCTIKLQSNTMSTSDVIIVPDDYPTIQAAIDHAKDGDTIKVMPGTYYENIVVNKMLEIIGESGAYVTIIDGGGSGNVVHLACDGVKINGFTIRNSGSTYNGIYTDLHYNIIQDNIIENNGEGINLDSSNGNKITGNKIKNNQDEGILVDISHMNVITGNTVTDNNNGIHISFTSNYNGVYSNIISKNNIGVKISETARSNKIYHNDFIDNGQNAYDDKSSDSNIWYNSTLEEGNYWDDYTGEDNNGDGIGDTPYNIPGGDNQDLYPLMGPYLNPPTAPSITGQTNGKAKIEYEYTFNAVDPDGQDVYYYIDWGDTNKEEWIGPYSSGENVNVKHTWSNQGTYTIKAKAKDTHGAESDWGTLSVTMPKNDEVSQSSQQQSSGSQQSQSSPAVSQVAQHLLQQLSQLLQLLLR